MPKILVIEDEKSVRRPLVDLLEFEGYEVVEAVDGRQGVKAALRETPDLVLCDIMMPGLDGFEVLRELRKNPAFAMTPFIFLTARIGKSDTERGLNLGADDFICKPFDPAQLIQRITARLEKFNAVKASMNQVRANLIGKVPHEFKTPLNGILGFASIMKENALLLNPAEVRDFSALILESGERMLQTVVNYVRHLELQMDIGKEQTPDKYLASDCSVRRDLLDRLLERLLNQYRQRSDDLRLFVEPARLAVEEEDFRFIVYQLLDNALKFSSPHTRVTMNTLVDSGFYVISVADRGQGMDEMQVASLGPFVQLNREEKEQQGLGLGLSILESLCKLYRGSLSINSTPGEGTRVIVRLPLADSVDASTGRIG